MNILLTIDDNYIDIAENMLYSLRQYNRNLIIHVVYDSLSKESLNKLKTFIEENKIGKFKSYYFDTSVLNIKNIRSTYITKTCYLRIFAPYVIPNIDRFLYMDPDIICRGSIRRLYNMNLGDKIIGAAKNMFRSVYEHLRKRKRAELKLPETFPYVNSGVLVVDTKKYKKYIKKEDLIEELRRIQESLEYQDQDYINMKFHDVIKIFSNKYNYQINAIDWCDINMNQVLIHYAEGKKPWNKNYHDIFRAMPYYNVLYDRGMDCEVKNLLFAHSTNNVYGSYGALKYDDNDIKLIKFTDKKDNYKLMHKWCSNEFIYEWFEQRKLSYDEIVNKYKKKLSDKKQDMFLISFNKKIIGYTQIYKYEDTMYEGFADCKNIYEFDIFIGEEKYLSRGIGTILVNYIKNYIVDNYDCDGIVLRPCKRNIRAVKCYKLTNFKEICEYEGTDSLGNKETFVVMFYHKK